ncbi:hypothetical protein SCHPADRAFT_445994 [Schizopora paradoxa]|uniref:Uncharacterized protein n=1 Tax=Schizopora paradoxa TaxID=27342 RepID=A0A0H2RIX2_9AGAM|nr:hypothetical protein SCHPADRAFT_445994 [Schizopora paradoxa]
MPMPTPRASISVERRSAKEKKIQRTKDDEITQEIYDLLPSKRENKAHPRSGVDLLGWYHSGGPEGANRELPWSLEYSFFAIKVYDGDNKLFSISDNAHLNPDITSTRGLDCLFHDIFANGWTDLYPRIDTPPYVTPITMQIKKIEISDDPHEISRFFSVHVQVLFHYKTHAMLGIRYEMDWKPIVLGILKSDFRW